MKDENGDENLRIKFILSHYIAMLLFLFINVSITLLCSQLTFGCMRYSLLGFFPMNYP